MSSSSTLPLDHHHLTSSSSEQLCYVHCNFCDTVLAVSVPCTSLFKMVTVRCGHCTNLLPVNMRGLLLPSPNPLHHFGGHSFFSPSSQNFLDQISGPTPNFLMNQTAANVELALPPHMGFNDLPKPPVISRILKVFDVSPPSRVYFTKICSKRSDEVYPDPEKRQRIPSAYNRFIKEEIQRIKAGNPDISHREAFSAAAKNWAHFPHIQFGLMPDQPVKKSNVRQQENGDHVLMKDGGFFSTANIGV